MVKDLSSRLANLQSEQQRLQTDISKAMKSVHDGLNNKADLANMAYFENKINDIDTRL